MSDLEHPDPSEATKEWIDLKFSGFRAEMRMLFILSVAGNQLLGHLSLSPALSYVAGGVLAVGAVGAKLLVVLR